MNEHLFDAVGYDHLSVRADEERSVADILADAQRELERADDLVRSYLQYACDRRSLQLGRKDWYRLAGESRIKDAQSVRGALGRLRVEAVDLWRINDLVGVRAVVLTLTDATELAAFIADDHHPFDGLESKSVSRESGYRAIHLKGRLRTDIAEIGIEIQIRTAMQDAWAVVSRSGLYGEGDKDSFVSQSARLLADQLATADASLDLLRRTLRPPEPIELEIQPKVAEENGKDE